MNALYGALIGGGFVVCCVAFLVVVNAAAQAVADTADRKAAARDAASSFCIDYIPDSSEVQATIARLPEMGQR